MSAARAIAILRAAFPRAEFPEKTVLLYGMKLEDLPEADVVAAVNRLINGADYLPSIAAIRREVAEAQLALPSPEEAWDIALRGRLRAAPPEVQAAVEAVGGRWTILHSENPTTIRAQFVRDYASRRLHAIEAYTGARLPTHRLPAQEQIGATMAALPESTSAFAPPVHARWLRRMLGKRIEPPTEVEKAHAIEILRDGPLVEGEPGPLYIEAERIFVEASDGA